jgi:hyaluronoglucosaminidase
MNFLMNCYTSMFSSLDPFINRWWEPLPEDKKSGFEKVVRACQASGIEFCFSMHPQLFSERPLVPDKDEDFEKLWTHYAWMQGLGVKWFNLCYDDIGIERLEKSALGEAHARLVNRLFKRLRSRTPDAQFIFCPTYYAGCGDKPDARAYLEAIGRNLHPEVYLFWTGDGVVTPRITRTCAVVYQKIVKHRLIIWDNYPVNDRNPTLHLGPVTGRDPDLCEAASGYMSNPLCPQNEINRIPLFTCADYALNPGAYDPLRSIGQAVRALAADATQRQALRHLVELYPGMLLYGETSTGYNPVLGRYRALLELPDGRAKADAFKERMKSVIDEFDAAFPGRYIRTKDTLWSHLEQMR